MIQAVFEHKNIIILEKNFCIHPLQATTAKPKRKIIVGIVSSCHLTCVAQQNQNLPIIPKTKKLYACFN